MIITLCVVWRVGDAGVASDALRTWPQRSLSSLPCDCGPSWTAGSECKTVHMSSCQRRSQWPSWTQSHSVWRERICETKELISSTFSSMLTLANASMNSSRLSWGNDSGILMSTSHPLGMNLHIQKSITKCDTYDTSITCRKVVQICSFNCWGKRNLARGGWNSVIECKSWVQAPVVADFLSLASTVRAVNLDNLPSASSQSTSSMNISSLLLLCALAGLQIG